MRRRRKHNKARKCSVRRSRRKSGRRRVLVIRVKGRRYGKTSLRKRFGAKKAKSLWRSRKKFARKSFRRSKRK